MKLGDVPADRYMLSLDVSSSAAGWALWNPGLLYSLKDFGIVRPPQKKDSWERIDLIIAGLYCVMEKFKLNSYYGAFPVIVMEWQGPYRAAENRNANGLATLGQAQGSVRQALKRDAFGEIELISERDWTKSGGWPVRKEKRAEKVRLLYSDYKRRVETGKLKDNKYDVADAIGLGIYRYTLRG